MSTDLPYSGVHSSGSILIVDDQENNRMLLRDALEAQGHTIIEACSGHLALKLLCQGLPDAVLLDVMMPQLDGFEVCRRIKANAQWAHVPVLLVTALTDRKKRLTGIQAGANDFITKPVDMTDVILRVRNAVRAKRLFDSAQEHARQAAEMKGLQQKLTHMVIRELRAPLTEALELLASLKGKKGRQWMEKDVQTAQHAQQIVQNTSQSLDKLIKLGTAEKTLVNVVSFTEKEEATKAAA